MRRGSRCDGATLALGSGTFRDLRLRLAGGGAPGRPKTLAGVDTGDGLPLLVGSWRKEEPAKADHAIVLERGLAHAAVRDLRIEAYRHAVDASAGEIHDVDIAGLKIASVRSGIEVVGGGDDTAPEACARDVRIDRCTIIGFTKRGVRLKRCTHRIVLTDCLADAGGKAWAVEPFHMGFAVEGDRDGGRLHDHEIRFQRCIARDAYNEDGERYWNADGFCAEAGVRGVVYVDCEATGCTDGGWDDKSDAPVLER